jgi:hypothetical protein
MSAATSRAGAHLSWSRTRDRSARTAPARAARDARFEDRARELLGPGATEREVAQAAESARRAHYAQMSAKGVAARRAAAAPAS